MNGKMKQPHPLQIEYVANRIVELMDEEELANYVYDDLYSLMSEDKELFYLNAQEMKISVEDIPID